jgi:hypothetical protein
VPLGKASALDDAVRAYRDATPDPLPAEVQRVVEAAVSWWEATRDDYFSDSLCRELRLAVRAYRSTQPEPLSARLARLGKGARVGTKGGSTGTVEANAPQHERLWLIIDGNERYPMATYSYDEITAILSESP